MFYSKLYRRHLLDMHIADWDERFLSQFSPENYVENLKKANVNYAMLYLQSHAGLCYFPTESGILHKAFEKQPDRMLRTLQLCHEANIRVCSYYSLIYNTAEHDRHSDWRMVTADGCSRRESGQQDTSLAFASAKTARYGLCCPNNGDYLDFVFRQIDEMLEYFPVDALFFDMPFWPHTCHCGHCRTAYGGQLPEENTPELIEFKSRTMGAFIRAVTDYVKARKPGLPVYHNFASAVAVTAGSGCSEEVLACCDYACGDLYGDLYNHSFACKFYKNATRNAPFEQMLSRCKPALRMHTLNKTHDQLCSAVGNTMAHHGATLIIDAIDPIGTMDSRVYELIGQVYRFQMPYEPWFRGEMVEQFGLYYSLRSRTRATEPGPLRSCIHLSKTLIRNHIPFGVTGSFHDLDRYSVLLAPALGVLDERDNDRLLRYAEQGGTLYLSGCGNRKLVEALTGNRYLRTTKEENLYLAPRPGLEEVFGGFNAQYPLPFECRAPVVEAGNGEVLATITLPYTKPDDIGFASIHSNPPGVPTDIPAVTVSRYGKGRVIWSALPLEDMPYPEYGRILLALLGQYHSTVPFFRSDAPAHVELTAFRDEGGCTLSASVLDEEPESAPVAPFAVSLDIRATRVTLLPEGQEIPFRIENGRTVFCTEPLRIFAMYRIE